MGVRLWLTLLGHSVLAYYAGVLMGFVFMVKNGWRLAHNGRWSELRPQVYRALVASLLLLDKATGTFNAFGE